MASTPTPGIDKLSKSDNHIPPRTANTPTKVYKGGCHCGKFEFECRHPVLEDGFEVISCNCSFCTQRGYLLMYVPRHVTLIRCSSVVLSTYYRSITPFHLFLSHRYILDPRDFKFLKGEESELAYHQFNKKVIKHLFCPACGSGFMAKANAVLHNIIIVNARGISDLDVEKLTLKKFNGRAL